MNSSGSSEYSMENFEIDHNNMQSQRTSPGDKLDMDDDDDRSLDSFDDGHSDNNTFVPISRHSPVSDDDLVKIPVRELNQRLQGYDRQIISALKQKRRTLKNRGYAYKCRVRRLQVQLQLEAENAMLKADLARQNQRLIESQHMKNELFMLRKEVNRLRNELYGEQNSAHSSCYEPISSSNNSNRCQQRQQVGYSNLNNSPVDNDRSSMSDRNLQNQGYRNHSWDPTIVPTTMMSSN
jgi:predicted kinase